MATRNLFEQFCLVGKKMLCLGYFDILSWKSIHDYRNFTVSHTFDSGLWLAAGGSDRGWTKGHKGHPKKRFQKHFEFKVGECSSCSFLNDNPF
jgi:hypothetical protein